MRASDLAFVDFLRPIVDRNTDLEGLLDVEYGIEKVEAVDTQVFRYVAFWLDTLARNIANLGNESGNGFVCRRHLQPPSFKFLGRLSCVAIADPVMRRQRERDYPSPNPET